MKIDKHLSRSGQPEIEDLKWLKEQGITDIINFRTSIGKYNEKKEVKRLGMNYHNIPTDVLKPETKKVKKFLKLIDKLINKGKKIHIHCQAGADRTGLYSFIYKGIKGIDTIENNDIEWIQSGHNYKLYSHLRQWAKRYLKEIE